MIGSMEVLVIPTKDRPRQLDRCMRSYRESFPGLNILVADESTDTLSREVTLLAGCFYFGPRERSEYLDTLSTASHVSRELLDWGTTGLGGTRNLLQLLMAGRVYASADDDTVARFIASSDTGLRFSRSHDPTRIDYYPSLDSLPQGIELNPFPVLSQLISAGAAVAQAGQLGDSGMAGPMGNGDRYERARTERLVKRLAPRPTLTLGGHLMLHLAAFDGRTPLAPFYPSGRGEDAILSCTLRAMGRLIGHAPIAVTHLPGDSETRGKTPREYRPNDALWHWLHSLAPGHDLATLARAVRQSGLEAKLGPFGAMLESWGRVWEVAKELACDKVGRNPCVGALPQLG